MLLDGSTVEKGDTVWHITLGAGTVETVEKGTARVRMGGERGYIKNMSENGMSGGQRVFFWGEPIIFAPRKNERHTEKKQHIVASVMDLIDTELGNEE